MKSITVDFKILIQDNNAYLKKILIKWLLNQIP